MEFTVLDTDRGAALTGTPWPEYPRPSLRRDSFVNLNGGWDFAVGDPAIMPENFDRTIRCPSRRNPSCPVLARCSRRNRLFIIGRISPCRRNLWGGVCCCTSGLWTKKLPYF